MKRARLRTEPMFTKGVEGGKMGEFVTGGESGVLRSAT